MIKNLLLTLVIVLSFSFGALCNSGTVSAQSTKQLVCQGATDVSNQTDCTGSNTEVNKLIKTVINLLSIFGGIAAVVMIIIGGLRYVTSSGAPEKVSGAKNTILYALIGLVIIALAQVIVRFVLQKTLQTG
jgi:hypothetical protein